MEPRGILNAWVVQIARSWIGTPYRHQASLKGAGCDCIGLILGIWRELYGKQPDSLQIPAYTPFWAEETGTSPMVALGCQYMEPLPVNEMRPGDVLMFRMHTKGPIKHAAVLATPTTMIHAYSGHTVCETALLTNRFSKLTHAFRFPFNPDLS